METPSSPPSNDKPQSPAAELVQPTSVIQQEAREEVMKPNPQSVFVNSEPMREDQVQNAVKFLSHPNVRSSPVMHRRSFLEKKGLTKEEIDEAFRHVPDPPPSSQPSAVTQEAQVKPTYNVQQPVQTKALQPLGAAPTGVISSAGNLARSQFDWYHAVVAVGMLAASGAGAALLIKKSIVPRLKCWIRKVVFEEEADLGKKINGKPSLAEEAVAAAKAAAAAAVDVAKVSQEMANSKSEDKRFEQLVNLLNAQVQEMKMMSTAIHKLEGPNNNIGRTIFFNQEDHNVSVMNPKQTYVNGKTRSNQHSVRPPTSAEHSVAPHPKSYMEIMAMVQRGEKPPNIRDVNDQPPNPNQQISNSRLAPRIKPWEVGQTQNNLSQVLQSEGSGDGLSSKAQDNGVTYQFNGESTVPWGQKKNARIMEIQDEDELKAASYNGRTSKPSVQHTLVPPQPPPVLIPEAAEAIRRPKPSVKNEQLADEKPMSQPTEVTDDLQRATKISESAGTVEINGNGSRPLSREIEEEQGNIYSSEAS